MLRPILLGYNVLTLELVQIPGSFSDVTPRTVISPLDHVLTNATFYSALIYDQVLDDSLLLRALEATLAQFHPLSGRLELVEVGTGHIGMKYCMIQGVCVCVCYLHETGAVRNIAPSLSNHRHARRTTTLRSSATTKELASRQQHATTPSRTSCRPQEPRSSSRCSCCPS